MRVGLVGFGFGIDAGRSDRSDGRGHVVGPEPAGQDHRDRHRLDDPPADAPVVCDAECPDLAILRPVAVEKQEVGEALIAPGDIEAFQAHHRHAAHDPHAGDERFQCGNVARRHELGCSPQVQDCRPQRAHRPRDEGDVSRQEEGANLRLRADCARNLHGRGEWLLPREAAVAHENADVVDANRRYRGGLRRSRDFVDLGQHRRTHWGKFPSDRAAGSLCGLPPCHAGRGRKPESR